MQIGDRFITGLGNTVELIDTSKFIVIHIKEPIKCKHTYNFVGDVFTAVKGHAWKYVGNFSKSENFSNLYQILNEETPN